MTTPYTTSENKNIKEEYSERQLTHTCFRCSARYPTSRMMVQHMRAEHPSFVQQPATKSEMSSNKPAAAPDTDRYKNAIATCPFCQHDCQTRKKLMRHLDLEHKDDNEQEEEPAVKVIRIDGQHKQQLLDQLSHDRTVTGPFVTPGSSESKMVQSLLKVIGTSANGMVNGNGKVDNKSTAKLQYKCFWCDASFRKRGKLMDHIDTLHKQNKQQNQAEAEMLSMDDKPQPSRHLGNHRNTSLSHLELPSYMSGLPYSSSPNHSLVRRSPHMITSTETKPSTSNVTRCSFTLAGSLTNKSKSPAQENTPPNNCKFYLGKKDNPLANIKVDLIDRHVRDANNQRRFSLPNLFDEASSSPYNFPFRMFQSNSIAAAMQHNYMMTIRPPMLAATQFYAPRMPMIMQSSDYMMNQSHPMIEQHAQSPQAQFFARMNAMAQMSPLARPKTTESPLDLTKSYV